MHAGKMKISFAVIINESVMYSMRHEICVDVTLVRLIIKSFP